MMDEQNEFVPTIDISPLFGGDMNLKLNVAREIDAAMRGSGFFYCSNHGVDLKELFEKTTSFHQRITDEERNNLAIAAWNKANIKQIRNGYQPPNPKKPVEAFCFLNPAFNDDHPHIKQKLPLHEVNVWPDEKRHPGFREFQENFYNDVFFLSAALLRGIALALGKKECFFDSYFKKEDTLSSVVLIRYPYLKDYPPVHVDPDGTELGFGRHKDACLLTVLAQTNHQNLQAETVNGFRDIPASDKYFLVNAGGYMDYITDGYYRAVVHRVKHVNSERLSIPFFCNLGYYDEIKPFCPLKPNYEINKPAVSYGEYLEKELLNLIKENGQR